MSQNPEGTEVEVTQLLSDFVAKVPGAEDRLFPIIYDELHGMAVRKLHRERPHHSFCPTELVNEAYIRLVRQRSSNWKDRAHFYSIAATIIRRVLVDHARARQADKRGGAARQVTLSTVLDGRTLHSRFHQLDVLALEEALTQLAEKSPPRAQVVELRFFAGLSVRDTASAMQVHEITVKRHWKFARTWLLSRMGEA